jgi:hypothetical protein
MKKMFFAFLVLAMCSCSAKRYTMGMSENEFRKHNGGAKLVYQDVNGSVYRITKVVMTTNPGSKFYYFTDGKLTRIDEGQRKADIAIDIHND